MTRSVSIALLLVGLGNGCAVPPHGNGQEHRLPAATTAGDIECHLQRVTGELIVMRVCTMKEQRDAIKQSDQDARDFLNRQVIAVCPGAPGCKN